MSVGGVGADVAATFGLQMIWWGYQEGRGLQHSTKRKGYAVFVVKAEHSSCRLRLAGSCMQMARAARLRGHLLT